MNKLYRQGDVGLLKIESLPEGARKEQVSDTLVLALGEATGHSHRLCAEEATLYSLTDYDVFEIKMPGELVHEEHSTISLEPGFYKVIRQREYSPEQIKRVVD
jgi:hypothetical protein